MLVIKVELHSANTGEVTELGRMIIANDGTGDHEIGNYNVRLARKGVTDNRKIYHSPQRKGRVLGYRRWSSPIWDLVARALASVRFYPGRKVIESSNGKQPSTEEDP